MKKTILLVALMALVTIPAFADKEFSVPHAGGDITLDDNGIVAGAILDAPNLVGITENTNFGFEVSKDLLNNPFDGDTRKWVDANDGYSVMAKITTDLCLFRCGL